MNNLKSNYIFGDFQRAFLSKRFSLSAVGVTFSLFYSLHRTTTIVSVYSAYMSALNFTPFMLVLIFCALPFSRSFIEDTKHKYIYLLISHGDLKKYILSKVALIYISSIIGMVLGSILFALLVHLHVPWVLEEDYIYDDILKKIFLEKGYYLLFFSAHSFFMGLLAGNMSALAAYISLYWQEELLTLSIPFLVYYLLIYYGHSLFPNLVWLDIQQVFNVSYGVCGQTMISLLWPLWISLFTGILLGIGIYKKLRRIYDK